MPKKIKSLIIWSVLGVTGLTIFILFFNDVFPTASIDIKLSKGEVFKKATDFIEEQGFKLEGYDKTIIFHSDFNASVYLQKTQGIKKSNELIREGIPVWFWRVRWFKELDKKGFIVDVNPTTGEIVHFYYFVLDNEKGANLKESQARTLAENKIALLGINLNEYILKDVTSKQQKYRTDYYFIWERKNYRIADATSRIRVNIYGDQLGAYNRHLKIPEEFSRYLVKETSLGVALTMISRIIMFLLTIVAIILLVATYKHIKSEWTWKPALIIACIVTLLEIVAFLNRMPLLWNFYPDTISKLLFIITSLGNSLFHAFSVGVIIFAYGAIGGLLSRELWQTKTPLLDTIKNKGALTTDIMSIFIVGYSLGLAFLGYITIFYLLGSKFFNIWMPPETEYSNILVTAIPFLFPLTIAISAAVREEFMYRLFSISFLRKYSKPRCLAVLIPALIWGFAHSSYAVFPNYVRGLELTLFGVVLGIVFLKYGLETVIIAHFVINALLAGLPLLRSHNLYFATSGIIVVSFALLPIIAFVIKFTHAPVPLRGTVRDSAPRKSAP